MRKKSAFTIVEIIVAIIILGILAAFAIPSYIVGLSRTYARHAMDSLMAIQSSQLIHVQTNNQYYVSPSNDDISAINQTLNLNISPTGGTKYYCDNTSSCHAYRNDPSGTFDIQLNLQLPMVSVGKTLMYCPDTGPNTNYNPCCLNPGETHTAGATCPSS